jgi:hypothetical protein
MWNRRTHTSMALIIVLVLMGSLVQGSDTEILPVNSPADLDLSGNIIHAINFGNNGNPMIDGVYFHQDQDLSNVTVSKSSENLATMQGGAYPSTGFSDLNVLLVGVMWKNSGGNVTTSVTIHGLEVGMSYQLQLIFYTDHDRPMNVSVEGGVAAERFDPYAIQEREGVGGGAMIRHHFTAGDNSLNISATSTGGLASLISGLILTEANQPVRFADFGSGTTTQLFAGGATWQLNWGQGPWTWSEATSDPLLDATVSAVLDLRTTAAADVSADLVATLPIAGTLTLTAHDVHFPEVPTGTMILSGAGVNVIDINAERVIVDEGSGMFLTPFHPPGPQVMLTLEEATGVFAHITQIGPWQLSIAGSYAIPLIEGLELQDNIMTALGGKVALIGGFGEFSLNGLYTVDASKLPQDFCEYGTGITERLAPDGGGWDQQWGMAGPLDWLTCTAETNVPFLNENVTGNLTTYVTGLPDISEDMILHIPLAGQMVVTEHSADNPDEVIGQITCDVLAMFVADMNAERAVVDEAEGTITVAFGASVEEGPDGLMTVTEATGTLADIQQVSPWEWHVNGTMQIVRVPELPLQQNILAALQNSDLLLGAEEEFALTGQYYRGMAAE